MNYHEVKFIAQIDCESYINSYKTINAAFRLACHSPHCRFDDDICTTAQAPLATEQRDEWPSGKQRLAHRSISLPFCPPAHRGRSQTVEFCSTRERCRWVIKPKRLGRWELQLWDSKRWSRGIVAASGKLVWETSIIMLKNAHTHPSSQPFHRYLACCLAPRQRTVLDF